MKRPMMRLGSTLFVAMVLAAVACKPSQGGSCDGNAKSCESPTSRYACTSGHYALETCKGEKGCKEENGTTTCDATRGDVGDPCVAENSTMCSTDGSARLHCEGGKLVFVNRCAGARGEVGCTIDDRGEAHCPNPFGKVGDSCTKVGFCTEDGTSELACKDGKLAPLHICRGDEKCVGLSGGPNCDRSTGMIGEECDPNNKELAVACEPTKETILTCKDGKLAQGPRCKGEGKCSVAHYGIDGRRHFQAMCDQSTAAVGDDCLKEGGLACSEDQKSRLICQMGKFTTDKVCKKSCEIHAADGTPFDCK